MTQRMTFRESHGGVFVARGGYAIRRDGHADDSPSYWIAYRPGRNGKPCINPQHEIGAGAGDDGWLKCVRMCEIEERSRQPGYAASMTNTAAPDQQGLDP